MKIGLIKILMVVTSHNQLGNSRKPTGYYLPEVTHPFFALEKEGFAVDIVSPGGGKAPMDERSKDLADPDNREFLSRKDLVDKIENTLMPSEVNASDYQAFFFAGGHGTMWDFPENAQLSKIAASIYERGGVVAAVCHGPAGLLNIKLNSGKYLVEGRRVTAFSNGEEAAAGLTGVMPFLLETELKLKGAKYSNNRLWQEHVVTDERLVTGQNPASAKKVGQEIARILRAQY